MIFIFIIKMVICLMKKNYFFKINVDGHFYINMLLNQDNGLITEVCNNITWVPTDLKEYCNKLSGKIEKIIGFI